MHRLILLLAVLAAVSCKHINPKPDTKPGSPTDSTAILADPKSNLNIQTAGFIEIDSSGIFMFPLTMGESRGDDARSYKEMPEHAYWNIIFLNGTTGEHHLLGTSKMLIRSYDLTAGLNPSDPNFAKAPKSIFYNITATDYNKDGLFTHDDPVYLFVSDKQGKGFRQISPSGYHLQSWAFLPTINKVFMSLRKDSNGNKKFEETDELTTFDINLDSGMPAREVFNADFKNTLKLLYDRDWKRVKN